MNKIYIFLTVILNLVFLFLIYMLLTIKLSDFILTNFGINTQLSAKIIYFILLLTTYLTLQNILLKLITYKNLPDNNKEGLAGLTGPKGIAGKNAICETCNEDDICYKKIIKHITTVINWWKIAKNPNDKNLYQDNYIIRNNIIKSKIKRQCKSTEFVKILNKFGANQTSHGICGNIGPNCGGYDYLYRMWTIWILIILKYEKGWYFLEHDSLNENDFINLLSEVRMEENDKWDYMFRTPSPTSPSTDSKSDSMIEDYSIHVKRVTQWEEDTGQLMSDKFEGLNEDFFKTDGVPDINQTPFDEIKNYKAWYWGSDDASKPILDIRESHDYSDENTKLICNSCVNDKICYDKSESDKSESDTDTIKFKKTNNFYKLFTTLNSGYKTDSNNIHVPFQQYGNVINKLGNVTKSPIAEHKKEGIIFMRPYEYVDNDEHPKYRHYKPVGDVVFNTNDVNDYPFSSNTCFPNKLKYHDNFVNKLVKNADLSSILVSGDIKSPLGYVCVYKTINRKGLNKNTAFTVWKPIPPKGYISLGYVIDTKPWLANEEPSVPSTELIACVPNNHEYFIPKDKITDFETLWYSTTIMDISKRNTIENNIMSTFNPSYDGDKGLFEIKKMKSFSNNPLNTFITNDTIKTVDSNLVGNDDEFSIVGTYLFSYSSDDCKNNTNKCFTNLNYRNTTMSKLICEPYNPAIHNKENKTIYNECTIHKDQKTCNENIKCQYDTADPESCQFKKSNSNNLKYSIYNIYNQENE